MTAEPLHRHAADPLPAALDEYVRHLRTRFGPALVTVVLFGSRARGEARPESDLDVLVIAEGLPQGRFDRYVPFQRAARDVSESFSAALSLILQTPAEAGRVKPYYLGMLSGHVLLFDREGFFAGVLERLQRRLAELGARRYVDEDGYEYWDLKPDWTPGDVITL